MCRAMRELGLRNQSTLVTGPFALAFVESAGCLDYDEYESQPALLDERWVGLFLGRLNHREDLHAGLNLSSAEGRRLPDSALALRAWGKWGSDCVDHLYGPYSFAVCDKRTNSIDIMRSFEGSQHIYLHEGRERIVVASSVKAIFAFPDIEQELDDVKLADWLVLNHEDHTRSFFKGVSILGQSRSQQIDRGGIKTSVFRDFLSAEQLDRNSSTQSVIEAVREVLNSSIKQCYGSSSAPAIALSSGLDSTLLAVLMIEHLREGENPAGSSLSSYTGVPGADWDGLVREGWTGDERAPVEALASMYPELRPNFVSDQSISLAHHVDEFQKLGDMPVRGVNNIGWGMAIRRKAKSDGHTAVVNGSGGNYCVSFAAARSLFGQWMRQGRWGKLTRETHQFASNLPNTSQTQVIGQAAITNLPSALFDLYMQARGHQQTVGFGFFSAINPDYARRMHSAERIDDLGWDDRYRMLPNRRDMMRLMMERGARNDNGGMAEAAKVVTGTETFSPLADRKLFALCLNLPDETFYANGRDRLLVRRLLEGKVPSVYERRIKGEQSADWHTRLKASSGNLLEEIDRLEDLPDVAEKIDLPRMRRALETLPEKTPVSAKEYPDYAIARYGIGRAIAAARFINHVKKRN